MKQPTALGSMEPTGRGRARGAQSGPPALAALMLGASVLALQLAGGHAAAQNYCAPAACTGSFTNQTAVGALAGHVVTGGGNSGFGNGASNTITGGANSGFGENASNF